MADELGVDTALAVEGLLEGEDDEHLRDALLDPAEAAPLPGPELWRNEPDDGNACAVKVASKAEVDVWEVNQHGDGGELAADGADETAVAGIDVGNVAKDLRDAHDCDVFSSDDLLLALSGHLGAAEASEGSVREASAEGGDDLGAIGVPGGLAGREKDARIGGNGDASSLSLREVVVPITWSARWLRVR